MIKLLFPFLWLGAKGNFRENGERGTNQRYEKCPVPKRT